MSTVARLRTEGVLQSWTLAGAEEPGRCFYYATEWEAFFNALPTMIVTRPPQRRRLGMREQVARFASVFVANESRGRLELAGMVPPFRRLGPRRLRLWEMRTSDTRSFGWFAARDVFVAVCGERTARLKDDKSLYVAAQQQVIDWLARHRVPNRELVDADDWTDLVSEPA